jgi:hypothetical protein
MKMRTTRRREREGRENVVSERGWSLSLKCSLNEKDLIVERIEIKKGWPVEECSTTLVRSTNL